VTDDARAAWIFAALIITVLAILDVVIQSFALHSALARGKVHAPEIAGIRLMALWVPTIAAWLGAGLALGLLGSTPACASADRAMLWLGVLYLLTAWPALALARHVNVRIGAGYWLAQCFPALTLIAMGGLPCL
jgi:hypothetical protein